MKGAALLGLFLALAPVVARATEGPTPSTPSRSCPQVSADLAEARAAGRLEAAIGFYREAGRDPAPCAPKALFCLGRSVALAHVEAAYRAVESGDTTRASDLFRTGASFGEPWLLRLGEADAATLQARSTHDAARWNDASVAYQKTVSALGEPALCPGEPDPPDAAAFREIGRKMALATLLARPLTLFHTRCTPCGLAFLTARLGRDEARSLPITFVDGGAALTAEGLVAAAALADCARAERWPSLKVSTHTDERGSAPINKALAGRRLATLTEALRTAGYSGLVSGEAAGKSRPLFIPDPGELDPEEIRRANRRVEIRLGDPAAPTCSSDRPAP